MQNKIATLNNNQKIVFMKAVIQNIDVAIHDFLFALQEQADFYDDFQIPRDSQAFPSLRVKNQFLIITSI